MRALTVIPGSAGSGAIRDVPDPSPADGDVVVDVIRVGVCGTDAGIVGGLFGSAPRGSKLLVIGHESFGRVSRGTDALREGTFVVASVRRPDGCPNCVNGESDMCLWGDYKERGIKELDGFCAERYAERPEFLFPIPPELADVAVLLEPMTVAQKGWRQVNAAQRRMTVWEPRRALVTGAGPVGILVALTMRLHGLDVIVAERTEKSARRALLARMGARYGATGTTSLAELAGGPLDLIVEATGSSEVAFAAMELLGPNGVLVLNSVTAGDRRIDIASDRINRRLVLNNALVLGAVNANKVDFEQGIRDLAAGEQRWPGFLASLITRRVPLERATETLGHDPDQIKQVVEVAK